MNELTETQKHKLRSSGIQNWQLWYQLTGYEENSIYLHLIHGESAGIRVGND